MNRLIEVGWLRSLGWRVGRFLYRWARREGTNDPKLNGEYWLIDQVIQHADAKKIVFLDVGANIGDWTGNAMKALERYQKPGSVHAFEPTASTFRHLEERFASKQAVTAHNIALSNVCGDSEFYVLGALAGRNSLHFEKGATRETVHTQTLDSFLKKNGSDDLIIVKTDTEGHDFSVLEGAKQSLSNGLIDMWQFEYNHRWAANRATLKSVFDLIDGTPYRLGKLYGYGIELYDSWHMELDRFFETNYVLIRTGCVIEKFARPVRFGTANMVLPGATDSAGK